MQKTKQIEKWVGEFGKQYTHRNTFAIEEMNDLYKKNFGFTRSSLNQLFIGDLDKNIKILEVGCNTGNQLMCLKEMGFSFLAGIEIQEDAVKEAQDRLPDVEIVEGSAFEIPFENKSFDLVMTSGVLIHLAPENINRAFSEIFRVSRKYVWGFEYYADSFTPIDYRGNQNLLWKADYAKLYRDLFDFELLREVRCRYLDSVNVDSMFLLKKKELA